ncbi:hypothetical protein AC792_15545, partial [Arthrobacter sp. RIT-PI-e]
MADRGTADGGTDHPAAEALAGILALVCVMAGLVSGRPETAALAAPFALLVVAARTATRAAFRSGSGAARRPAVLVRADGQSAADGSQLRLLVVPDRGAEDRAGLTATVLAAPGSPLRALVLGGDEECPVLVEAHPSGEAVVLVCAGEPRRRDPSSPGPGGRAPPGRVGSRPPVGQGLPRPVAARLRGSTGGHVSRRPGESTELRPGPPLRE